METVMLCLCLSLGAGGHPPRRPPDRLFGEDKFQHFFVSFVATSLAGSAARAAGTDHRTALWVGAGAGLTAGAVKELLDLRSPAHTPSLLDFAWDVAGVGAGSAVAAQAR